jgi:hypothetical protein
MGPGRLAIAVVSLLFVCIALSPGLRAVGGAVGDPDALHGGARPGAARHRTGLRAKEKRP